jgi:hypothetical protein
MILHLFMIQSFNPASVHYAPISRVLWFADVEARSVELLTILLLER